MDGSWASTTSSASAGVVAVRPSGIAAVVRVYGLGAVPSYWHCIMDQGSPSFSSYSHFAHYELSFAGLGSRQATI